MNRYARCGLESTEHFADRPLTELLGIVCGEKNARKKRALATRILAGFLRGTACECCVAVVASEAGAPYSNIGQ